MRLRRNHLPQAISGIMITCEVIECDELTVPDRVHDIYVRVREARQAPRST